MDNKIQDFIPIEIEEKIKKDTIKIIFEEKKEPKEENQFYLITYFFIRYTNLLIKNTIIGILILYSRFKVRNIAYRVPYSI